MLFTLREELVQLEVEKKQQEAEEEALLLARDEEELTLAFQSQDSIVSCNRKKKRKIGFSSQNDKKFQYPIRGKAISSNPSPPPPAVPASPIVIKPLGLLQTHSTDDDVSRVSMEEWFLDDPHSFI